MAGQIALQTTRKLYINVSREGIVSSIWKIYLVLQTLNNLRWQNLLSFFYLCAQMILSTFLILAVCGMNLVTAEHTTESKS